MTAFKPGDRVLVAEDASWTNGTVTYGVKSIRGKEDTFVAFDGDGDATLESGFAVAPRFLTLVMDSGEKSIEEEPVLPISREQRVAWIRVEDAIGRETLPDAEDLSVVLALLPSELTNGLKPPEEPGFYLDAENSVWQFMEGGLFFRVEDGESDSRMFAPFVKLEPARPEITANQIRNLLGNSSLLSSEMDKLVALANGRKV